MIGLLTLSSIYTHFKTLKKKASGNFTFFHNVFYAISIVKSFNSHIIIVVSSFFEFGTVSKWCNREWVDTEDIYFRLVQVVNNQKGNLCKKGKVFSKFFFDSCDPFYPPLTWGRGILFWHCPSGRHPSTLISVCPCSEHNSYIY